MIIHYISLTSIRKQTTSYGSYHCWDDPNSGKPPGSNQYKSTDKTYYAFGLKQPYKTNIEIKKPKIL